MPPRSKAARICGFCRSCSLSFSIAFSIDFDAPDGEPVDLMVGLLVPEECTDGHLQLLAQLAELFSQEEGRESLRNPVSPSELLDILSQSTHHV